MICINVLKSIYGICVKGFSINWLKTLYVNFSLLQFKCAIKCPIVVYHRVEVHIRKSKMLLTCPPILVQLHGESNLTGCFLAKSNL